MRNNTFVVGTVVTIKTPGGLLDNPKGTVGVCYENYETGSSFIFENGNYDGFSIDEQASMLDYVGIDEDNTSYQFKNVIKVSDDFRKGLWKFESLKENT